MKAIRRLFGETTAISGWVLALPFWPIRVRALLLTLQGGRVHGTARLFAGTAVVGRQLAVGPRSFVNAGCHLDATEQLTIGADVHLSPRVMVLTVSHAIAGPSAAAACVERAPVTIEDGAWIGAGAIIFPGVTVGKGAVVGAGLGRQPQRSRRPPVRRQPSEADPRAAWRPQLSRPDRQRPRTLRRPRGMRRSEPGSLPPATTPADADAVHGAGPATGRNDAERVEATAGEVAAAVDAYRTAAAPRRRRPRPVPVTVWRRVDLSVGAAFDLVVPIDLTTIFGGYGPLPAVVGVDGSGEPWGRPGQRRTVRLLGGGQMDEVVVDVVQPGLFRYEVVPVRGALRLAVGGIDGRFLFARSEAGGTVIRWTYVFHPGPGDGRSCACSPPSGVGTPSASWRPIAADAAAAGAPPTGADVDAG